MAERLNDDGDVKVAVADVEDRISALPEDVIQQLLSWLPSHDAVQTCVLARDRRNRWKTVPRLRIYHPAEDMETYGSFEGLSNFVNNLLRSREQTLLDECVINTFEDGVVAQDVELWIRYAVSCKVKTLKVFDNWGWQHLQLSDGAFVSKHLTVLELCHIEFSLDFGICEALEVLKMENCIISYLESYFPESLRHLTIRDSGIVPVDSPDTRPYISAPGLVTLEVSDSWHWTPWLDGLPSLMTAYIRIEEDCEDCCSEFSNLGECGKESCEGCYVEDDCLLLKALSGATNLELISEHSPIFKDLKWCPVFSNLKTLLLNEWCVAGNFEGLVYFLQHPPILERLTLQLRFEEKQSDTITGEMYNPRNQFFVSKHLKASVLSRISSDALLLCCSDSTTLLFRLPCPCIILHKVAVFRLQDGVPVAVPFV